MSQAVAVILAEYFELNHVVTQPKGAEVGGVTLGRMEALERKLEDFIDSVEQRFEDFSSSLPNELPVNQSSDDPSQPLLDMLSEIEDNSSSKSELPDKLPTQEAVKLIKALKLNPIPGTKLSKLRFGLGKSSLASAKRKQSTEKFTEWTKSKDPDGIAWRYIEKPTKGYLPVEKLSEELMGKLLEWVKENNLQNWERLGGVSGG